MTDLADHAIAIVGLGAILPDAPDAGTFWANLVAGRSSITEVPRERWDPDLYYDADPRAPDKTYSKIGGWVRSWDWSPLTWRLPVPPRTGEAIDDVQKWAVACTRAALLDSGWPGRPLAQERTAVILGNAMGGGEKHYQTARRVAFPETVRDLAGAPSFRALPAAVQAAVIAELRDQMNEHLPKITEDTMPGELGNCVAGRVANLFGLRGANFVVDAACASTLAALAAAIGGLIRHKFDAAICGGIDRNMGAWMFVKLSRMGALSATGSRPFDASADGFVMGEGAALFVLKRLHDAEQAGDRIYAVVRGIGAGEGAALFVLKRLHDAEQAGDRIYAVVRGIGAASDGRGKAIAAPNPAGQRLAVERAWRDAGLSPATCSMLEAHGTSTPAGDLAEITSLTEAFAGAGLPAGSVALGSVKSNIGHLRPAAGAAGLLKATLALHEKLIPASLGFEHPNPNIDWASAPLRVNTQTRPWDAVPGRVRCAAVSAFGFGGTNFHVVLEEYVPGRG